MKTKKKRTKGKRAAPESETRTNGDVISEVIRELAPMFVALQGSLRAIGEKLFENRERLGLGGIASCIQICHARWGVSHALLRTWYRVAAGEIPESLVTGTKIQKTTLQHMPTDIAESLAGDDEYWVVSAALGKKVRKRVTQMTADECARHIRPQGYVRLEDADDGGSTYRNFRASGIAADPDSKRIILTVETARITVSAGAKALQKALEKIVAGARE